MAFPTSFIDELVSRNPIDEVVGQYVSLTRKGGSYFGLCPFHSEKTPSFHVDPSIGICHCFGCHKGGGVINFVMEIESLDYPDAVRFLAKRAGMEVPEDGRNESLLKKQDRLRILSTEAARWFRAKLNSPEGEEARAYIQKRALSPATVARFGLGFAPDEWFALTDAMTKKGFQKQELLDAGLAVTGKNGGIHDRFRNRLMFPIIDVRGNVIGFGGRVMDNSEPKYLNSPETIIFNKRKNLFALNIAKKSRQGRIILTEGYMDAISLHQYGFDCAVASLGTALTEDHANILAKYTNELILTYDGDEAGQNATRRAIPMLEKVGLQVKVLRMQGAKDPDEFLKKYGADRFSLLLDSSENQADYQLESIQRKYNLEIDDQRVQFLKEAAVLISSFPSSVQREVYGNRAAELAKISPQAMKIEIEQAYKKRVGQEKKKQAAYNMDIEKQRRPVSKEVQYQNLRSAMAEESLIRILLREPSAIHDVKLSGKQFSVPLFGRVFDEICRRAENNETVNLAVLEQTVTREEMAHLSRICSGVDCTISDDAITDCVSVIETESSKQQMSGAEDLLQLAQRMKQTKAYGG